MPSTRVRWIAELMAWPPSSEASSPAMSLSESRQTTSASACWHRRSSMPGSLMKSLGGGPGQKVRCWLRRSRWSTVTMRAMERAACWGRSEAR